MTYEESELVRTMAALMLDKVVEVSADKGNREQAVTNANDKFWAEQDKSRSLEREVERLNQEINRLKGLAPTAINPSHIKTDVAEAMLKALVDSPAGFGSTAGLVQTGEKIRIIKAFRQVTGEGLKESKDAVERALGIQWKSPPSKNGNGPSSCNKGDGLYLLGGLSCPR